VNKDYQKLIIHKVCKKLNGINRLCVILACRPISHQLYAPFHSSHIKCMHAARITIWIWHTH